MKTYHVYILANWNNTVIYIGITSQLARRLYEHRQKLVPGFTQKYNVTKLVYVEETTDVQAAIAREKKLKGWRREKKNQLIASINPDWNELYPFSCHPEQSEGSNFACTKDPSLRSG